MPEGKIEYLWYITGWGWKCSTPSIASPCHTLVFTGNKVERKELWLERQEILWTYFLLLVSVLNKILFVKFTVTSFVLMLSILSWQNTGLQFCLKIYLNIYVNQGWLIELNNQEYWCNGTLPKRSYQISDFGGFLMPRTVLMIKCVWKIPKQYFLQLIYQ
jgi:hypothetical protein